MQGSSTITSPEEPDKFFAELQDELTTQAALAAGYYHALRQADVPDEAASMITAFWIGASQHAAMSRTKSRFGGK